MTDQHPITPTPELVSQWIDDWNPAEESATTFVAKKAARWGADWGADIELDACCEWIANNSLHHAESDLLNDLRAARRPQPKSLTEQALKALDSATYQPGTDFKQIDPTHSAFLRRALDRLKEMEGRGDD